LVRSFSMCYKDLKRSADYSGYKNVLKGAKKG
jgi:hypothetical protein